MPDSTVSWRCACEVTGSREGVVRGGGKADAKNEISGKVGETGTAAVQAEREESAGTLESDDGDGNHLHGEIGVSCEQSEGVRDLVMVM